MSYKQVVKAATAAAAGYLLYKSSKELLLESCDHLLTPTSFIKFDSEAGNAKLHVANCPECIAAVASGLQVEEKGWYPKYSDHPDFLNESYNKRRTRRARFHLTQCESCRQKALSGMIYESFSDGEDKHIVFDGEDDSQHPNLLAGGPTSTNQ
jgi:hypothetical protein